MNDSPSTCDLPDDVVLSVRHVSKKFCRNLRRSMWYGMQDLGRNLLGLRPGRDHRLQTTDYRPEEGAAEVQGADLPQSVVRRPSSVVSPSPISHPSSLRKDEFWALQDINFDLKRGEILGVIGANGSGKTTLLRLLTGIFPPDAGGIAVRGRISALIALGAGFHPHMTGRENIYLNGSILGMGREEIQRKFDAIVDFAEIGDFLEAPVSTYSSGMTVRLGFAIAAHLEPEVLLVDEVLSVGDIGFREKCFGYIRRLLESKVSIILVSHYLAQVSVLTDRCLWLDHGVARMIGSTDEVLAAYHNDVHNNLLVSEKDRPLRTQQSTGKIEFSTVRTVDKNGRPCAEFTMGEDIVFQFDVSVHTPVHHPCFAVGILTCDGVKILLQNTRLHRDIGPELADRNGTVQLTLHAPPLLSGRYSVWAGITSDESNSADYAVWPECHYFTILAPSIPNANHYVYSEAFNGTGVIRWDGQWELPW